MGHTSARGKVDSVSNVGLLPGVSIIVPRSIHCVQSLMSRGVLPGMDRSWGQPVFLCLLKNGGLRISVVGELYQGIELWKKDSGQF